MGSLVVPAVRSLLWIVVFLGLRWLRAWGEPAPEAEPADERRVRAPTVAARASEADRTVRLYFPSTRGKSRDCRSDRWVRRELPAGANPLNFTLRRLFAGPTAAERRRGFSSPFTGKSNAHSPALPVRKSFRRAQLRSDGTAVVKFDADALTILNAAMCFQTVVKSAIDHTLSQFRGVQSIAYSVDGQIVTDWDG